MQGPLHKAIKKMIENDTGTNIHKIYVKCSLQDILKNWNIVKRDIMIKNRKLKITEIKENDYCIELHRPKPAPKNELILQ